MDYNNNAFNPMEQNNASSAMEFAQERAMSSYIGSVMRRVYAKMFLGLLVSAVAAFFAVTNEAVAAFVFSSKFTFYGLMLAELGLVFWLSARIDKMSNATSTLMFYLYALINGLTMSVIFLAFTESSIVMAFLITAGMFAAMSIYGYVTKKSLASFGSFLFMALIGLIIASIVNIFLGSSTMYWIISIAGVAIFVGLTAWDTQKIKMMAMETDESNVGKLATMGALSLYLDFVNLFLYLLRIFGSRD